MMRRIWTIISKEWAEVFKNRMVLFTVIFMPLILTILPIVILFIMHSMGDFSGEMVDMPAAYMRGCGALTTSGCVQLFMMNQFMIMFMIMPIAIPVSIAAYSIVGEKTTHSLEPLLATPISTEELLAGKSLAAGAPAIAATWLCFLIFWLVLPFAGVTEPVRTSAAGTWFPSIFLISPLIAMMAVIFSLIVSSRVTDPRAAEQISMIIIAPVMGILLGQMAGFFVLNAQFILVSGLVLLAIDIGLLYASARLFQREVILTKWR